MLRVHLSMPHSTTCFKGVSRIATLLFSALLLGAISLRADQVETQSGDRYVGKVVAVTTNTVTIQNDVLGTVTVPRNKVTSIAIGSPSKAPAPATLAVAPHALTRQTSNAVAPADLSAAIRQLGTNSPAIRQVQEQYLGTAGPEANSKFNELLGGLANGSVSLNDLSLQARQAADQLRAYRKDLGEESGAAIDTYLAILDSFVREVGQSSNSSTNSPATPPQARHKLAHEDD